MKVKTDQILKSFEGKPIQTGDSELGLKICLFNIFNYENNGVEGTKHIIDVEQKIRNYKLIVDLNNEEIQLKSEDIAYAKKVGAMIYPPLIFGQIMQMLEPDELDVAPENPPEK